ncbi:hypothetical protein IGI96_003801 [Enterococcus sp. DIV0421]|uniref:hypothetical protein n=1 Tax=Enterococcus sp. DIV0421 TaxID=2774688 RepID=UPI003F29E3F3
MKMTDRNYLKFLLFCKFSCCILILCSLVFTSMEVNATEKDNWQVSVNNITKNVGDTVTKAEVISAVTTTAAGKSPVTKTLVNTYEGKFPFNIQENGYYSFPVQVIYKDGSITEVVVKVVTNSYIGEEKSAISASIQTLLTLIQENPNVFNYPSEIVDKYKQAQQNAYNPYWNAFNLLKKPNLTLEELQKEHQSIKENIQNIQVTKNGLVDEEKRAIGTSLETLLALIQENPNTFIYTSETANNYTQAQQSAYDPYNNTFQLLKQSDVTLEELQKEHQNVKAHIQSIQAAKNGLIERTGTEEEIAKYRKALKDLEDAISSAPVIGDSTTPEVLNYREIKKQAEELVRSSKDKENLLYTELQQIFKNLVTAKNNLEKAQQGLPKIPEYAGAEKTEDTIVAEKEEKADKTDKIQTDKSKKSTQKKGKDKVNETKTSTPKTGDHTNLYLYVGLLGGSGCLLLLKALRRKLI